MNKMLIVLFSLVSLLVGSSFATEECTLNSQCPSNSYCWSGACRRGMIQDFSNYMFAFDGCTDAKQSGGNGKPPGHGWKDGDNRPGYYDPSTKVATIACCAMDGSQCSRRQDGAKRWRKDGACRSEKKGGRVTWNEAKEHCEADGMRLCQTQAELDGCCRQGCQGDNKLVWGNVQKGLPIGASGVVPGVNPECLIFSDCPGKKSWCKNGFCT